MALVARAQSELEWPKTCSQGPPLVYAVKIVDSGLHFLFFIFTFFFFYFIFLFLEQLGLGFISHAVTSVTS